MKRRDFMKIAGLASLSTMLPSWTQVFAGTQPTLPIPTLLKPDSSGLIKLNIQKGQTLWRTKPTLTWGYNGPLLGPAISARQGQKINMEITNSLDEETTVHWHGLEVPGMADGGPQTPVAAGATWKPSFTVSQSAATCWYHPHPHMKTGRHVAMGLGGLLLVHDDNSERLDLPKTWGIDDIPVIIQDKRLNNADQIDYTMDVVSAAVGWFGDMILANGTLYPKHEAPTGWLRLRLLNACNARSLRIATSDSRPLYVIASDGGFLREPVKVNELTIYTGERFEVLIEVNPNAPFDLVSLPVRQMGMTLPPFDATLPFLRIQPTNNKSTGMLPDALAQLPLTPKLQDLPVRRLQLSMDMRLDMEGMHELKRRYGDKAMGGMMMDGGMMGGSGGGMMGNGGMMNNRHNSKMHNSGDTHKSDDGSMMHGGMMGGSGGGMMGGDSSAPLDIWHANRINGQSFDMNSPMFNVKRGQYERWIISGKGDMMLHPFHIHGTQFRILSENGAEPEAHRAGLKDTVHVEGRESEVLVRFLHTAPKEFAYMAHCHLLEHEDTGMMMCFTVSD